MWRLSGLIPGFALIWLAGCAAPSAVPVVERRQPPSEKINTHWVAEGETLYAIAWRYNLDVEQLAQANGLDSAKPIYRGQTLRIDVASALAARRAADRSASGGWERKRSKSSAGSTESAVQGEWRWPVRGELLKRFSFAGSSGHKGLDIKGSTGQAVYAAQAGVVVYAGSGLPAYGNLLIVKHERSYLSAYAHNSRLVVKEGQRVSVGQKVAEVGQTGTTHQHLHFEIRKQGRPVNPLKLLPKA